MKKLLLLLLLLPFCSVSQIDNKVLNKEFVVKLNEYRKQKGLDPVVLDESSIYRAKLQAEYCAKVKDLTHDSPSWYPNRSLENILFNSEETDASVCMKMWKNSEGHNDNLLNPEAVKIGIYMVKGFHDELDFEGYYVALVLN